MRPTLLLTRPEPQARRFAAQAHSACPPHDVLIAPLSEVVDVAFDRAVFDGVTGVVLTSANAVPRLKNLGLEGLPAWCVGPATAKAARAAGFDVQPEGGGDARALIATLIQARPSGVLVHAHGVDVACDLVAALRPQGIALREAVVYQARACTWSEDQRRRVQSAARIVAPLFSPRAAAHIAEQLNGERPAGLHLVAISDACAARLPAEWRVATTCAQTPDSPAMLRSIAGVMSQEASDGLRHGRATDK